MSRLKTKPQDATVLTSYAELDRYVRAFADGHLSLLIVIGSPGLQKSTAIQQTLPGEVCWLEGNATAFALYCRLYEYRDRPVVLDDVDDLYTDKAGLRLLKSLCQTTPYKIVRWDSDAYTLRLKEIPTQFSTASKVAIIANQWKTLNEHVAAIEDRGHVVLFEPTAEEVHRRTAEWFRDDEIFEFVGRHLCLIESPSMRDYYKAVEKKRAGLDWRAALLQRWLSPTTRVVAQLLADQSYPNEKARIAAFQGITGRVRSQYFYHKRKLRPPDFANRPLVNLAHRTDASLARGEQHQNRSDFRTSPVSRSLPPALLRLSRQARQPTSLGHMAMLGPATVAKDEPALGHMTADRDRAAWTDQSHEAKGIGET